MNTPGFGGYLLAIVVSWIAFTVILFVMVALGGELFSIEAFVLTLAITAIPGTPIGVLGALLVHIFCQSAERQWVHVLVAGIAGVAIPVLTAFLYSPGGVTQLAIGVLFCAPIGLAAMIGRAAVIGLVHARQAESDARARAESY